MSRKTYDVEAIREESNRLLACSYGTPDYRLGVSTMVEWILMRSDNYKGFRYLTSDEVPKGEKPGIRGWLDGPHGQNSVADFTDTDETRRYYF